VETKRIGNGDYMMDILQFHIRWKNYLRNRLLAMLRRAGVKNVFRELKTGTRKQSIAQIISDMDYTQISLLHSIERLALGMPAEKRIFRIEQIHRVPAGKEPDGFAKELHDHYIKIIYFIGNLRESDLEKRLETSLFESSVDTGWILHYTSLIEQSVTGQIETIFQSNKIDARPPWATASYMGSVRKLDLK